VDLIQAGTITVQQVGSYAGFAAMLGLAVLSALYFSQARDVKRLRDWAGRAPERDAEARSRVAAATSAGQTAQGQPATPSAAQPAAPAAQPATAPAQPAAANSGNSAGAGLASKAPALAASAAGAGAAAARPGLPPATARPGAGGPGRPLGRPSAQTSILGAQEQPHEPWYRRIAPRYIALIVAGVLVVGGGIAVGTIQLLKNSEPSGANNSAQTGSGGTSAQTPPATIRPGDVSVAVLNATGIGGLADQFADKAQAQGFHRDNVGNAPGGQRAESVVLYAPGKEKQAKLVRRKFNVSNIEPVDPESQALAPQADAILVIGSDNTQ
jgi:hypothetical protein